jgi:hypothetical protein
MKFGTAFATAALCVFGFITFMKTGQRVTKSPLIEASSKVYSEAELKDAVAKAVNQATTSASRDHMNVSSIPTKESADRIGVNRNPPPSPKGRRPLSRNERQQLAADLRLLSRPEDDGIELLSDRINQ